MITLIITNLWVFLFKNQNQNISQIIFSAIICFDWNSLIDWLSRDSKSSMETCKGRSRNNITNKIIWVSSHKYFSFIRNWNFHFKNNRKVITSIENKYHSLVVLICLRRRYNIEGIFTFVFILLLSPVLIDFNERHFSYNFNLCIKRKFVSSFSHLLHTGSHFCEVVNASEL